MFLRWYLLAATVLVVGTLVHRIRGLAGTPVDGGAAQLGPQQVAYLNGGDQLAVWTALGGLCRAGAVGVHPDRRIVADGPMPAGVTPWTRPSTTRSAGACTAGSCAATSG